MIVTWREATFAEVLAFARTRIAAEPVEGPALPDGVAVPARTAFEVFSDGSAVCAESDADAYGIPRPPRFRIGEP